MYAEEIWWLETSIIGFATLVNLFSVYWAWRRGRALRRPGYSGSKGSKTGDISVGDKVFVTRLPAAVLTASRIVAFRWRIPYVNMTVLELFLTIAYMAALFIWDFTRCASIIIRSLR